MEESCNRRSTGKISNNTHYTCKIYEPKIQLLKQKDNYKFGMKNIKNSKHDCFKSYEFLCLHFCINQGAGTRHHFAFSHCKFFVTIESLK